MIVNEAVGILEKYEVQAQLNIVALLQSPFFKELIAKHIDTYKQQLTNLDPHREASDFKNKYMEIRSKLTDWEQIRLFVDIATQHLEDLTRGV